MRKNDAFVAKIVTTRLTKISMAIFVPDERLAISATLRSTLLFAILDNSFNHYKKKSKNSHENFNQARIYNSRDKCVVFAHNRKFAKSTQWNMQYIPCNSALLAQETLFLTQKGTFLPKDLQKVRKSQQILIREKLAYVRA